MQRPASRFATPLLAIGIALVSAMLARGAQRSLDEQRAAVLRDAGFTGAVESNLTARLGRPVDPGLADLGRKLWFDKLHSLGRDNTCGGCHSPTNGSGDTQSMAIGVQNNNLVGPRRAGPRNQRRSPLVVNTAFFPAHMWNGRFNAPSGDPFDNSQGFVFPLPEGATRFPPGDPIIKHLLQAQGHIPPTELVEVAGFTGTRGTIGPEFDQFDDGLGEPVPLPDGSGFRFARGDVNAMTTAETRGALLFFGKARCVACHAVRGPANEMFSDFENRVAGVPPVRRVARDLLQAEVLVPSRPVEDLDAPAGADRARARAPRSAAAKPDRPDRGRVQRPAQVRERRPARQASRQAEPVPPRSGDGAERPGPPVLRAVPELA